MNLKKFKFKRLRVDKRTKKLWGMRKYGNSTGLRLYKWYIYVDGPKVSGDA